MRVLHVFDTYLPHTMNWAYRLMKAAPDVELSAAASWMVGNKYYEPSIRFYRRPLQSLPGMFPATEWGKNGFSGRIAGLERRWPVYRNWLARQLKNDPPDLIHAHFAPMGCHYAPLAKELNIPLLCSFYGYDYESLPFQQPVYRTKYRQLFQDAAAITVAGPHGKSVVAAQGCAPEKIHISPMSMRPEEFPWVKRTKQAGQLRLVQIATITEKKGFEDTLRAFAQARKSCPNITLTLAGELYDRDLVQRLQAIIRDEQLENQVRWLDFVPHEQLPQFLADFDVFIQPSHYTATRDCEGGPVSVLEAQSSGMPVIATTHFDIPTEVIHGQTGLLAAERDIAGLAAHIETFYQMDDVEYQLYSQSAHTHVAAHFDVQQTAIRLRRLYETICTGL